MAILSDDDVQRQLKNLKDWTVEGRAIRKQYTFNDFPGRRRVRQPAGARRGSRGPSS